MEETSREPNGPLGKKPSEGEEQGHNTVNQLGHNNEGYANTGFVSQGAAPELAQIQPPRQPEVDLSK
jgi:hypothetical protein